MFKFKIVAMSQYSLSAFVDLIGQDLVNRIDRKEDKFGEAVTEALDECPRSPHRHLFVTVYYDMPIQIEYEFRNHTGFMFSCQQAGLSSRGLISGSFYDWKLFIEAVENPALFNILNALFSGIPYFKQMQPKQLR